ncbi:MAG TPA: MurR/RpiR family transcriptional regulator [Candidatus Paceibacterota bacterium]|nr:MurR/RpiR family transcriptional regulator [Candidatus Paceibacterota bacterium]
MVQVGILTKLRKVEDQVTVAEASACNFITNNAELVIKSPLHVVAEASGTSEATIIRLCRKVDLSGFQELRLALARDHKSHQIDAIHEDVALDDEPSVMLNKVFAGFVNTLNDTLKIIDAAQFQSIIDVISSAKSISFFGLGASGSVAQNAYYRFMRLGVPCYVLTDSSGQLSRVSMLGEGDVVVVISHSGRSRDVIFAVEKARERGAICVAVTQYGQQPLVKASDFVLFTSSTETVFRTEAMASRVAHQALLDAVFVGVSLTRYETVIEAINTNRKLTEQLHK